MSVHALPPKDRYQLRNDATVTFQLQSSAQGEGVQGAVVKAVITRHDNHQFRYEVVFRGDFSASKPGFTQEMYWETGLSVIRSQLESHVHRDTRIVVQTNSGLPGTEVGIDLDWVDP